MMCCQILFKYVSCGCLHDQHPVLVILVLCLCLTDVFSLLILSSTAIFTSKRDIYVEWIQQ